MAELVWAFNLSCYNENQNKKPKIFKIYPKKVTVTLKMKIHKIQHKVGVRIIEFGFNSNKTTTGHKPQGTSLNRMVVRSCKYGRSLTDIFICKKLNHTKKTSQWIQIYFKEEDNNKL